MTFPPFARTLAFGIAVAALTGCAESTTTLGTDQGPVSGSAGPSGNSNASSSLEKCERPLGIITLVESQDPGVGQALAGYGLGSPIPVLRLLMQQSNCFTVVDRGQAMQNILQERQLSQSGELRGNSRFGGGQLVAADLALTPNVTFSGNTGGSGFGLGAALIPGVGGLVAGSLAQSVKFSSAQTILTLTDTRSGVQVSSASGTATARDVSIGGALFGGGGGVGGGGSVGSYSTTPEGKVVSAALLDAFNNVVKTVRGLPPLPSVAAGLNQAPIGGSSVTPLSTTSSSRSGGGPAAGKIYIATGNLNLREGPSGSSAIAGKISVGTEVTATGKSQNGFWEVRSGDFQGWLIGTSLRQK